MNKTRFSIIILLVVMMLALRYYSTMARDNLINTSLLWLNPTSTTLHLEDTADIIIQLDDVTNVFAAEMGLEFDSTLLAVIDADSEEMGVQIDKGVCPSPDFVLTNIADNTAGMIEYVITQLSPTSACDGGEVASIEFQCLSEGTSQVTFTHSLLSDPNGSFIAAGTQHAVVECSNNPPSVSDPMPADSAIGVSILTDLSWTGGDLDPDDSIKYDVYFGISSPPYTLLCDNTDSNTCNPGTLTNNTTYYWQVIAIDNHGTSTASVEWKFTTGNSPPFKPNDPAPVDNATGISINTDLSWVGGDPNPVDTMAYDVLFGTSSPPTTLLCDNIAATTCDPGRLTNNTTYYWQVTATDNHGASTNGDVWKFSTEAEDEQPLRIFLPFLNRE
jgi:hypothetical protein